MEKKCLVAQFLTDPREFAQCANVRDFVGTFTTSCEAQKITVSKRRANTVIGGSA